jgi:hypothetical protein
MKKTIKEIQDKIKKVAADRRMDAAYAGSMSDGGASELEAELDSFIDGFNAAILMCAEYSQLPPDIGVKPIEVPKRWQALFRDDDPEYQMYIKLKEKFNNL